MMYIEKVNESMIYSLLLPTQASGRWILLFKYVIIYLSKEILWWIYVYIRAGYNSSRRSPAKYTFKAPLGRCGADGGLHNACVYGIEIYTYAESFDLLQYQQQLLTHVRAFICLVIIARARAKSFC